MSMYKWLNMKDLRGGPPPKWLIQKDLRGLLLYHTLLALSRSIFSKSS